jgi:hypothetical protein
MPVVVSRLRDREYVGVPPSATRIRSAGSSRIPPETVYCAVVLRCMFCQLPHCDRGGHLAAVYILGIALCVVISSTARIHRAPTTPMTPPYLLAAFWIKEDFRWEQPTLTYKNEFIVSLQGLKGVLGVRHSTYCSNITHNQDTLAHTLQAQKPFQIQWSTSPAANDFYGQSVRSPVLKVTKPRVLSTPSTAHQCIGRRYAC